MDQPASPDTPADTAAVPDEGETPAQVGSAQTWPVWRGSPELLAHVIRVAERACEATETTIDVEVRGDNEVFTSADDSIAHVTPDALRHFSSLSVDTSGENMAI